MSEFNMPGAGETFERRGGYVLLQLMQDFGLTESQAGGIVGNIGFESMGFKALQEIRPTVEGSRGGYGWAQWTGPRRRAFEGWCEEMNLLPSSDEANYGFLSFELSHTQQHSIEMLHRTTTLESAVFTFGYHFEKPGGTTTSHLPGYDGRLHYAERAVAGARTMASAPHAPVTVTQAPPADDIFTTIGKKLGIL